MILDKRLVTEKGNDGPVFRAELLIRYELAGQTHEVWTYDVLKAEQGRVRAVKRVLDRFNVGVAYPCWYVPTIRTGPCWCVRCPGGLSLWRSFRCCSSA